MTSDSDNRPSHERAPDQPLRGLTAAGRSKVGVEKAMRARDVSRPAESWQEEDRGQDEDGAGNSGSSPVRS